MPDGQHETTHAATNEYVLVAVKRGTGRTHARMPHYVYTVNAR